MRDVKRFPTTTGLSWLEMSSFKDHLFKGHEKIGKEYDYVIVGGGYGGYGCASRLAETIPLPGRSAGGTVLFFMGTLVSALSH